MSDASEQSVYLSARTFLAGVGAKLTSLDLFGPIAEQVNIHQKTVKDSPVEKLYDGFIGLLCGAKGMVEVRHHRQSRWLDVSISDCAA